MNNEMILLDLEDSIDKASHVVNNLLENYDLDKDTPTDDDNYALAFNRGSILTDIRILNDYIIKARKSFAELEGGLTA